MDALADWIASEAVTNCSTHSDILYGLISRQADPTNDRAVVDAIKRKLAMVMGDELAVWLAVSWNNETPQGATFTSLCLGRESEASALAKAVHNALVAAYEAGFVSDKADRTVHTIKEWNAAVDEPKLYDALLDAIRNKASSATATSTAPVGEASARPTPPPGALSIDQVLTQERSKFRRLSPLEAHAALTSSPPSSSDPTTPFSILIDIRPAAQRLSEGSIPGALIIERNVLEWRLDPQASSRLLEPRGIAERYDNQIIVFCSEGYTSSLAAASLLVLGLGRATDIEGGFWAWKTAGLPTEGGQGGALGGAEGNDKPRH